MGVGDLVSWTRTHQQLTLAFRIGFEHLAEVVVVKSEAALKSTRNLRRMLLPGSPFRQWPNSRQLVDISDFLQEQVCQRGGGFADCETWMPYPFQQSRGESKTPCD